MMNSDIFEGKWKQVRGELKNWWGKLTDDDVDKVEGNYDKFLGILQERYGYNRAQAEAEIEQRFTAYESKYRPIDPLSRDR
jgi:uncharacterized protein YjbJ (UPF0337 family)